MTRHLADVNVLFALLWPPHEGHSTAQDWFEEHGQKAWATNPITQLGVVRLLSNPSVNQAGLMPAAALDLLTRAIRHPKHEFWQLDAEVPGALKAISERLTGHRQWTDALLLWQSVERGGVFVTFDTGVKSLAALDWSRHVLLLKSRQRVIESQP